MNGNLNGAGTALSASAPSLALRRPACPARFSLLSLRRRSWRLFLNSMRASYFENEVREDARPHPGPLPQERGKHAPVPGNFTQFGVASYHGDCSGRVFLWLRFGSALLGVVGILAAVCGPAPSANAA